MKYRIIKLSEQIKQYLAYLIKYKLKDPRIKKLILIHTVMLSIDIKFADIYWTIINENKKTKIYTYANVLNLASGYLRYKLSRYLKVYNIPNLRFHYSKSSNYKLNKLINKISI